MSYRVRFEGFYALPALVSQTCLVSFDNNRYSVAGSAVRRPGEIRAYAERLELRQDGRVVGEHPRCFERNKRSIILGTTCPSWRASLAPWATALRSSVETQPNPVLGLFFIVERLISRCLAPSAPIDSHLPSSLEEFRA